MTAAELAKALSTFFEGDANDEGELPREQLGLAIQELDDSEEIHMQLESLVAGE